MNKKELEKIYEDMYDRLSYEDFKSYVFENIIPEVLKSMLIDGNGVDGTMGLAIKGFNHQIKGQAKEVYNIDL